MSDSAALTDRVSSAADAAVETFIAAITVTNRLEDVAVAWRQFERAGVVSPGQSYDFIRLWNQTQKIPDRDQLYVVAAVGGAAVAILPLCRRHAFGIRVLSWFPGVHVGCNAPLADTRRLARMTSAERRALWHEMLSGVPAADLVHLPSVPICEVEGIDVFAELGVAIGTGVLYRAQFGSWEDANTTQRSKSRRKHDRQQGERLDALGAVTFEELEPGEVASSILQLMFHQRSQRFKQMGVADPFSGTVRQFYNASVAPGSDVPVKLHVLRLDGEVVAVRYNLAYGERLFCLISSMSDDCAIQVGSPGKQCLLRVMQRVFDNGYSIFDMGAGFTDEKRHWCNVQIPLRQHYLPLTWRGAIAGLLHRAWQRLRHRVKSDEKLLKAAKGLRATVARVRGRSRTDELA